MRRLLECIELIAVEKRSGEMKMVLGGWSGMGCMEDAWLMDRGLVAILIFLTSSYRLLRISYIPSSLTTDH